MGANWGTPLTLAVDCFEADYRRMPRKLKKRMRPFKKALQEMAKLSMQAQYGMAQCR